MSQDNQARFGVAAVLVVCMALVAGACVAPPVVLPDAGEPGSAGPCEVQFHTMTNDADWRHPILVAEPTGGAAAPNGGTCDDDERPVVLIAHGYFGTIFEGYEGLVRHLVEAGFYVIYPAYTIEFDPPHQYDVVNSGFVQAADASDRLDLSRLGVVGHSFGGGMLPWLVQQADARGWGQEAFWAVDFAPWFALAVGDGAIDMPDNLRFVMVNYEWDYFVDTRIGIELFSALDVPADQKQHVVLLSDRSHTPPLEATHLGPVTAELIDGALTLSTDHFDYWNTFRVVDATASCSLSGTWCDTDFTDVGTWPDGTPVKPALLSDHQKDIGPPALQECEFYLNERPCP